MKRFPILMLFSLLTISVLSIPHAYSIDAAATLRRADPAPDSELDRAPLEAFAWFSEPLHAGSRLSIFDAQFQAMDVGSAILDSADATLLRTPINALAPGHYTAKWHILTASGEQDDGSYEFTVLSTGGLSPLLIGTGVIVAFLFLLLLIWIFRQRAARRSPTYGKYGYY